MRRNRPRRPLYHAGGFAFNFAITTATGALTAFGTGLAVAGTTAAVAGTAASIYGLANQPKAPGSPKAPKLLTDSAKASFAAQNRTKQQAAGAFGRSDTIRTGPLGLMGQGPGTQKKLLGL